jgi:hydroxymethylbilane synthase
VKKIRIGTRKSPLALTQAYIAQEALVQKFSYLKGHCEIIPFVTTGDKILDSNFMQLGGKGLFTKEIEEALFRKEIDIAVHSMKDMPTHHPPGLCVPCILPRADIRDVFISKNKVLFKDLPYGAVIGTASLRRQAQLLHYRPDLNITLIRGNVQTRLRKVLSLSDIDATLLAKAGLDRLGLIEKISEIFSSDFIIPAVGQGALGIECREDDKEIRFYLEKVNHLPSMICLQAERTFLEIMEGSCRTPIGAYASINSQEILTITGFISEVDGTNLLKHTLSGSLEDPVGLGRNLGEILKNPISK